MSRKTRREIPRFETPLVETHCHLDYLAEGDLQDVLERSWEVGVERIITIAVSPGNLERVRALAHASDRVWGTQGIHPHEAGHYDADVDSIRHACADPTERGGVT